MFIVLLLGLLLFNLIFNNNLLEDEIKSAEKSSVVDEIFEKINNKDDILIFIKDEKTDYSLSRDAEQFINYYERVYDLNFIYIDRSKISDKDYKRILKKFYIEEEIVEIPFAILVKDGEFNAMVNQLIMETYLRDYLIVGGFIDKKYENMDCSISYEDFLKLYKSEQKNLFVIYTYADDDSYNLRKNLFEIFKEIPINYYIIFDGVSNDVEISRELQLKVDDKFKIPALIITENNEIIDYISSVDKNEIMSFLRKYDYIN